MRIVALLALLSACAPSSPPEQAPALPTATLPSPISLGSSPLYAGHHFRLTLSGGEPGATARFWTSTTGPGSGTCVPGSGCLGLVGEMPLGDAVVDTDGIAWIDAAVPTAPDVWAQAMVLGSPEVTNVTERPVYAADRDIDRDGLTDLEERALGTGVFHRDTDGDNMSDGDEVAAGYDPFDPDMDDDRVRDGREDVYGCDPLNPDSDGDGQLDGDDMWPTINDPSDGWAPQESYAADPSEGLTDPEFDEQLGRVAWQDPAGDELWVADVDRGTGDFVPWNGKGWLVDEDIAPMHLGKNGPEWVYHATGSNVLYTTRSSQHYHLAMATWDGAAWATHVLADSQDEVSPIGSLDPWDPSPRLRWLSRARTATNGWREIDDPSTDTGLPSHLRWSRWIPGERKLVGTTPVGDKDQVFTYDIDTGLMEQLTFSPTNKGSVFFTRVGALGGELMFFATLGDAEDNPISIGIFRSAPTGGWRMVSKIHAPPGYPYVVSPEPFSWNGISYVSFLASKEPENHDNGDAVVWIASLQPGVRFARRVSRIDLITRKDPEPYTGGDRPWIYYTEVDGLRRVVRCELGL